MPRMRPAPVVLCAAALAAACSSEPTSSKQATAVLRTSRTSLVVGDTLHVKAGLLYRDGRFEEFPTYTVSVVDTSIARVMAGTKIVQGKNIGDAKVRVEVPGQTDFRIDSTYRVNAAP